MLNVRNLTAALAMVAGMSLGGTAHAFDWTGMIINKAEKALQSHGNAPATNAPAADGSFAQCANQFPQGKTLNPNGVNKDFQARALCFDSFAVLYSGLTKTPMITVENLSLERLNDAKDEKRTNHFYEEARLPSAMRSTLNDYKGSGMDRGHMAPAGDMPNPNAMAQSFSLANMVPQNSENNQKVWNKLESDVRKYAKRAPGSTYVYTGPLFYHGGKNTLGSSKVWIPDQLFKLVYNLQTQYAFAYILDNNSSSRVGPPMDYAEFVRRTKYDPLQGLPVKAR